MHRKVRTLCTLTPRSKTEKTLYFFARPLRAVLPSQRRLASHGSPKEARDSQQEQWLHGRQKEVFQEGASD